MHRSGAIVLAVGLAGCSDELGLPDPGPLWEPAPAYGITLTDVSINQGVHVEFADDGQILAPSSPVLGGRDTLLRAHWQVLETDEPHNFRARMTVHQGEQSSELSIIHAHSADPLGYFQWIVPADLVSPDARFEIELLEDPDSRSTPFEEYDPPPSFPAEGTTGFQIGDDAHLEVWVVPIEYEVDGCHETGSLSPGEMRALEEKLVNLHPVSGVTLELTEPIHHDQGLKTWTPILVHLSQWRVENGVPPHVHVIGILDACRSRLGGHRGQALMRVEDPSPGLGFARVAGVMVADEDYELEPDLIVHEIGHLLGRGHAECKGNEPAPDEEYPYPGGRIGKEGFDVIEHYLWNELSPDVMSYCRPAWVSDYGWNASHEMLAPMTEWSRDADVDGRVLVGVLDASGPENWWVVPGAVAEGGAVQARLELGSEGESGMQVPLSVRAMPHGAGRIVLANLPADHSGGDESWRAILPDGERVFVPRQLTVY